MGTYCLFSFSPEFGILSEFVVLLVTQTVLIMKGIFIFLRYTNECMKLGNENFTIKKICSCVHK